MIELYHSLILILSIIFLGIIHSYNIRSRWNENNKCVNACVFLGINIIVISFLHSFSYFIKGFSL